MREYCLAGLQALEQPCRLVCSWNRRNQRLISDHTATNARRRPALSGKRFARCTSCVYRWSVLELARHAGVDRSLRCDTTDGQVSWAHRLVRVCAFVTLHDTILYETTGRLFPFPALTFSLLAFSGVSRIVSHVADMIPMAPYCVELRRKEYS